MSNQPIKFEDLTPRHLGNTIKINLPANRGIAGTLTEFRTFLEDNTQGKATAVTEVTVVIQGIEIPIRLTPSTTIENLGN